MTLTINWNDNDKRTVDAERLNTYFARHRPLEGYQQVWVVTHIPSGRRLCYAKTKAAAQRMADRVVRKFGAKAWRFHNPDADVLGRLSGCKELVESMDCWR